jgi:hypothetical protein
MTARNLLLFSSDHGEVHACAYFGRLVLTFKGFWMCFDREGFARFHNQVMRLASCPLGRRQLQGHGLRLLRENGSTALKLEPGEAQELVWLLDSTERLLAAQNAGLPYRKENHAIPAS